MSLLNASLAQLVDVIRGITFPTAAKSRSAAADLVPCLRTTNVQERVTWDDLIYVPEEYVRNEAQEVRIGDILVSMSNSLDLVGKCALVTDVPIRATFGAFIAVVRPRPGIDPRYVFYAMRTPAFRAHIRSRASTTTNISNINSSKLLESTVPFFGDTARREIVSKIDELFSRIDEGECALERVQKLVERYRQSVLKSAITGELTCEWREQRKGKLESGEALLQRILKARREVWEKAELERMGARGIQSTNDKWKQNYPEPTGPDTTALPDLPEGWVWTSVDQVSLVSGGLTKNRAREGLETKRPYLRVANVYANRLELSDVQQIGVSENELDRVLLKRGDVLVVEGNGSIDQIGRVALWDGSIEGCVHQNHLIKVRCTDVLPSWYVLIWCMSPAGRAQIRRVASSTAGLHTLSISKVQALPLPLPTGEELSLILDRFAQMDSLVAEYGADIKLQLRKCVSLRQSLLGGAFSGQLVSHDADDEPASVLLERIAAERSQTSQPKPTRRLRRAKP